MTSMTRGAGTRRPMSKIITFLRKRILRQLYHRITGVWSNANKEDLVFIMVLFNREKASSGNEKHEKLPFKLDSDSMSDILSDAVT